VTRPTTPRPPNPSNRLDWQGWMGRIGALQRAIFGLQGKNSDASRFSFSALQTRRSRTVARAEGGFQAVPHDDLRDLIIRMVHSVYDETVLWCGGCPRPRACTSPGHAQCRSERLSEPPDPSRLVFEKGEKSN
jgi:hypothetical protein